MSNDIPEEPGYPHKVKILCPGCDRVQLATVHFYMNEPWPDYTHICECGYAITESEWNEQV